MFRIRRYRVVVFGVLLAWSLANRADAIRYELIDGAGGDQDGHMLAGFIEFDSPCGKICTSANVTDFTFAVSGPNNYSYSYQSSADVDLESGSFLNAGATYLTVDYLRAGGLTLWDASQGSPLISWFTTFDGHYISGGPGLIGGWQDRPFFLKPLAIGVVIPEPSMTVMLWGSVVSFLMARNRELGFTKIEGVANHVSY